MKRLHVIHNKTINDIDLKSKGKVVGLLESETLAWAEANKKDAYSLTLPVRDEYLKNPSGGEVWNKYFKYLRRLFELKLLASDTPATNKELTLMLKVESMQIPEYISCTQMNLYNFCERKWFYAYALRIPQPVTAALHFGKSIDDAFNFLYEEKIKGETPPRSAVYAQFYESFEKGKDKVEWGTDDPKYLTKIGPEVIDSYLASFDSLTNAIDIQTECNIHLDRGGRILGFIDILEKDAIVDTKTAAKFWEEKGKYAKHLQELQPLAYSLWFLEEYERMPKEFRYQIVTKPKAGEKPQTQLIRFELKKFEVEAFRRRAQKVWDEIMEKLPQGMKAFKAQASLLTPGVLCTKEWCAYAKNCEEQGLRVPLKWVSKTPDKPGHHIYEEAKSGPS